MRIYIVEDDLSVINILEDIIETQELGEICGDCGGEPVNITDVLQAKPDVVLVDFFMPVKDGVEFVKELRAVNTTIKCSAGIDFFISKPINLIEVRSVLKNVEHQITNEHTLANIRKMFMNEIDHMPKDNKPKADDYGRKLKYVLNRVGMSGEKGCPDIIKICEYLHENRIPVSSLSVAQMCEAVSDSPKNMEQRIRRTIAAGMSNIAHMGIEDFMNETYTLYSGTLFSFEDVKAEMDYLRGKRASGGKVSIKKFIDGLMLEVER